MFHAWASKGRLRAALGRSCHMESLESRALLSGTPQLPDLIPWADQSQNYVYGWTIDTSTIPGHTLLRLTTAMANIGVGPLELVGGTIYPDGTRDVYQRIYNSDGTYTDQLAGRFVYDAQHQHTHFENFGQYSLREPGSGGGPGNVVAGGTKTSFCLSDDVAYSQPVPGASNQPIYVTCTPTVQGISPGWADVYEQQLEGQWVDITGVPNGNYWLEVMVDPLHRLAESNTSNNTVEIPVKLGQDISSPADAKYIGSLSGSWQTSGFVGNANTQDYYKLTVSDGNFTAQLSNLSDNANMELYTRYGKLVAQSTNRRASNETISIRGIRPGTYFVRVYQAAGDTNYNIRLTMDQAGSSFASATNLGWLASPLSYNGSVVGGVNPQDCFKFGLARSRTVSVLLAGISDNVDIQLFDGSQKLLAQSNATGVNPDLIRMRLSRGYYYVRVYRVRGDSNYTLTITAS